MRKGENSKIDLKKHVKTINEDTLEVIDVYCSYFGCHKKLSAFEKLFTDRCPNHPNKEPDKFFNGKL